MFGTNNDSPAPADVAAPEEVRSENDQVDQNSAADENVESAVEETTAQTDDVGDDETDESPKPKRGFAKRIERFNQKLSAKDQEIEYWRQVALKGQAPQQQPTADGVASGIKPKFSDFNDIEAYAEALTDWKLSHSLSQVQQQTAMMQTAKTYEARLEQFKKTAADFDDVMTEFVEDYGNMNVPEVIQVAYESDVGPQLAYHLAKNPTEFERIAKLPSHRRLLELGKLEDKISAQSQTAAPAKETKKISAAPKPVQPVKGTGKVESLDLSDPNLSYSEWLKRREATLKRS